MPKKRTDALDGTLVVRRSRLGGGGGSQAALAVLVCASMMVLVSPGATPPAAAQISAAENAPGPIVLVSAGTVDNTLSATDNKAAGTTTWVYRWILAGLDCPGTFSFEWANAYTEGTDLAFTPARNGQRVCFRSTDQSDIHGFGGSPDVNVDVPDPTVVVGRGSTRYSFRAVDDDPYFSIWGIRWLDASARCDDSVSYFPTGSYVEGASVSYGSDRQGEKLCFRSRGAGGNGYGESAVVDLVGPEVEVTTGRVSGTFAAVDGDLSDTTWLYVWIAEGAACNASTGFAAAYSEGSDVAFGASRVGRRLCFLSEDANSNDGYGTSAVVSTDSAAPTVTVTKVSGSDAFSAVDDDSGTVWRYVWVASGTSCGRDVDFGASTAYSERASVFYDGRRKGQRVCFRSADANANIGYGASAVVDIDDTAPRVVVLAGGAANSFRAIDDKPAGATTWGIKWISASSSCGEDTRNIIRSYTEGDDMRFSSSRNGERLCLRSTDARSNHGYGRSPLVSYDSGDSPPSITVTAGVTPNTFVATDNKTGSTLWAYRWITGGTLCDSTLDFAVPNNYAERTAIRYGSARNDQRVCFRSSDGDNGHGYRASPRVSVDTAPPTISVTAGAGQRTYAATDDDPGRTTMAYVWIASAAGCGDGTGFAFAPIYDEGSDVSYSASYGGRKLCFRSADASGNRGYATSGAVSGPQIRDEVPDPPGEVPDPSDTSVPAAPANAAAAGGDRSATVTWDASGDEGGGPISSYTATAAPGGRSCNAVLPGALRCTVTGLSNGTAYTFTVVARNAHGVSQPSPASPPVTPEAPVGLPDTSVPEAPANAAAAGGDRSATVTWDASGDEGGGPISSYTATAAPGGRSCNAVLPGALRCTVTGLSNGTAYTFTVVARNAHGVSQPSPASPPVTPAEPPPVSAGTSSGSASGGSGRSGGSGAGASQSTGEAVLVLANGWSPADVGVAAVLAARTAQAAVLYTEADRLSAAAADLISQYQPRQIIIVGGTSAVSDAVAAEARSESVGTEILRVVGADRTATAAGAARRVLGSPATASGNITLIIANGWSPPDIGVAAALAAATDNAAVAYSSPGALPDATTALIEDYQPRRIILVGGTAAISADVETAVHNAAPTATLSRIAGQDRIDTAAQTARQVLGAPASAPDAVVLVIANGWSSPDIGVAAALAAATDNATVAYTSTGTLPQASAALIRDYRPSRIILIGGTAAITADVKTAIEAAAPSSARILRYTGATRTHTAAATARRTLNSS